MYPGDLLLEGRISNAVRDELIRRGHKVSMRGPWSLNASAAIMVDAATGTLAAGADPRVAALALAW
jgi:gamma-glutamyltranspeptidase/glutathione hydrolase